jgi:hypothetical protein
MRGLYLLLLSLTITSLQAQTQQQVAIMYFNEHFGHVHQNSLDTSASLTTVSCGHPVKIIDDKTLSVSSDWFYVFVGENKGYIRRRFLSVARPDCFQNRYPKFVNGLNLDITELHYWGRLYDHFLRGESKIQ